jgi:perosamine synthetase
MTEQIARTFLPYGRQCVDEEDIAAVIAVLRSDWLTTGPVVEAFENDIARFTGALHAVAVSSGTAALHAAMYALEIGPGDEVIVPSLTFAATVNAVLFRGGTPVFADIDPDTFCIDPARVKERITPRTRAVIAVDYAGQPCDYDELRRITDSHGLALVADACHSLGAEYRSRKVGALADLTVFSFHPVKHITTGEGGMTVTDKPRLAERMRMFRNHGITNDHRQRSESGTWFYEMEDLGYNYRLTDIQCALGRSQLHKLPGWLARRREIAARYDACFRNSGVVEPVAVAAGNCHAYHLYVVRVQGGNPAAKRARVFSGLRQAGIGANVHYIPVHLHPFYRRNFSTGPGLCPIAEDGYERVLSLPMFPQLTDSETDYVAETLLRVAA